MSHVAHYIAKSELLIFCLYLKFWEAMFITGMFHCAWLVGLVVIIDSLEGPNVSHQVYLLSGGPASVVVSGSLVRTAAVACLFRQGLSPS